ncbi:MAG: hypothetical protein HC905_05820 [Bacteroidales bacterium]|nr:hypothetical protein [Bacteroidales bacterium]
MKKLFPEKHDSIILGYSKSHLDWCKSNLNDMWTFLIEKKTAFLYRLYDNQQTY